MEFTETVEEYRKAKKTAVSFRVRYYHYYQFVRRQVMHGVPTSFLQSLPRTASRKF